MELTGRQKEFLSSFLDLYLDAQEPLRYTDVANKLGISKNTAYDMLKLLEARGLVSADYLLPEKGPGRSTIVFYPTSQARSLFTELAGENWAEEEWVAVKNRILEALRSEQYLDYQELLAELVTSIPDTKNPMLYATEMIAAILLALHQVKGEATTSLRDHLPRLGLPGIPGLNALAGVSLGLSFASRTNRSLTERLASYAENYQANLSSLNQENLRRLSEFVLDVTSLIDLPDNQYIEQ